MDSVGVIDGVNVKRVGVAESAALVAFLSVEVAVAVGDSNG